MSKRPVSIDDLLSFKLVSDPQFSPDGARILFGLKTIGEKLKSVNQLWVSDLAGGCTQLTQGSTSSSSGRWAPNGSGISFVSARDADGPQIMFLPTVGEAHALTKLTEGSVGDYKWSPNSEWIAFTFRETALEFTKKGKKEREEAGMSEAPLATEAEWYRLDGDGYFGDQRYKLYLLNVATREVTLLSDRDAHGNYDFWWSPSSDELGVIRSACAHPFREKPNDQIYRVRLDGSETQVPGLPVGEKQSLRWSPDGTTFAWAGNVDLEDPWGVRNTHVFVCPVGGGEVRNLTEQTDHSLTVSTLSDTKEASFGAWIEWREDSGALFGVIGTKGETHFATISLDGGIELHTQGKHLFAGNSVHGGSVVGVFSTPTMVPELAVVEDLASGTIRTLTSFNSGWHSEVDVRPAEEIWLDTPDNTKLHGWVIKPAGEGPWPAVLEVHGGPHAQYGWAFFHEFQVLAAQGYVVVYTNPRGSTGYGEAHTKAIQGDWGTADWVDIQTATAWMKSQSFIDSTRMGVMGGSYGGYMTNWVIGHTKEYKAAITDRCVSNFVSMAGNSDFPMNKDGYFKGNAWGDLNDIKELWRQSPISFFKDVTTPTLVIHSAGDLRCNIEQGEQVYSALQQNGVPTRFVRYPASTSHGMSRSGPADLRQHRLNEIVSWWKRFL
jgi:dipeptidyl aminopeptidase/acylaminoacyl peptidase